MGRAQIAKNPGVFAALWPGHALGFLLSHGVVGFLVLGSVFLVVTGGEALYADLGHFGRAPIRIAWFFYVLPALLLNYFGQGALILRDPAAVENPFFLMAPGWATYPLVFLAATATVIASQAVISGSFSLTRQAIQLGFLPRMRVVQTSSEERGQVYVPFVNWTLMVFTLALVFGFRSSSNLAGAYGVGVSTDMVFTTLLFSLIAYQLWKWPGYKVLPMFLGFIVVDLAFWGANIVKVPQGGWVPLVVASVVYLLMSTWKFGREILHRSLQKLSLSLEDLVARLGDKAYPRIAGTAVYLSADPKRAPDVLLAQLEHYGVVHERVVILTVRTSERPRVEEEKRVFLQPMGEGVERLIVSYGFMETPNLTRDLSTYAGLDLMPFDVTFFLGRELVVPTGRFMPRWREVLFALMRRNAESPVIYFHLPPERALEIGVFARI
jgi:KUP system potassium uptake protein